MRLLIATIASRHCVAKLLCTLALATLAVGCEDRTKKAPQASIGQSAATESAKPVPWPPDNRRQDVYVGSLKCAECHQDIFDEYFSQHPMGRSVQDCGALNSEAQASLPAEFTAGNRQYGIEYADQSMRHTEEMRDSSGTIYSRSAKVDFAIGSGTRGYSFISEINGCLYQSSATWYSQGDRWDLSPGYQPEAHHGFGRRITGECIFCHVGAVNQTIGLNRFEMPIFAEASIGCERCHGPGNDHVAFHSFDSVGDLVDDIVNPSKLESVRRDSVCFQCHLHGKDRILRTSRKSFDFRPGDLISDVWVVLVDEGHKSESLSELEAVTQSEQMVASACYKNSNGQLGCISCHSPHGTPDAAVKTAFYRNRCLKCHDKPDVECSASMEVRLQSSKEDSCIQCHMPKAAASDVPHTAQTDHRVLKSYSATQSVTETKSLGAFEPSAFPLPPKDLQRAKGLNLETSMRTKREALATMQLLSTSLDEGNDVETFVAASWTMLKMGDFDSVVPLAQRAIELDPDNESALEALAIALQQKGEFKQALPLVERIVELAPWSYGQQALKAKLLTELGRKQEAIAAWNKALEVAPLEHSGREALIQLLQSTKQPVKAEAQAAILSRIRAVQQQRAVE